MLTIYFIPRIYSLFAETVLFFTKLMQPKCACLHFKNSANFPQSSDECIEQNENIKILFIDFYTCNVNP